MSSSWASFSDSFKGLKHKIDTCTLLIGSPLGRPNCDLQARGLKVSGEDADK